MEVTDSINLFPNTTRAIITVSEALDKVRNLGFDEKVTPHDDYYTTNIGLHIAQALWMDHKDTAIDIAKYICVMGDIGNFNVNINYE